MQLMFQLLPAAAAIQFVFALVFEQNEIGQLMAAPLSSHMMIQLCGFAAFAVNYTQMRTVAVTSALTHSLSGQFKTGTVILGSYLLFGSHTSWQQLLGSSCAMMGLVLYSRLTLEEQMEVW